jgi:hypothetical protein
VTVSELIAGLLKMPRDARVLVRGYEANHNEVDCVTEVTAAFDVGSGGIYGKHAVIAPEVGSLHQTCDLWGDGHDTFLCTRAGFPSHAKGTAVVLRAKEDD